MKNFEEAMSFDLGGTQRIDRSRLDPEKELERTKATVDRWVEEQMFEEDVRAMLLMVRPHKRERLMGWKEYRTGGSEFRVAVTWSDKFEQTDEDRHPTQIEAQRTRDAVLNGTSDLLTAPAEPGHALAVPKMADVIEALLVGSMKHDDDVSAQAEFEAYRKVLLEVRQRLDEMQRCYE